MSRAANQRAQPATLPPFLSIYCTSTPTDFHLMQSTVRVLENIGFSTATPECLTVLASMMKLYFDTLSLEAKAAAEHGRSEVNVMDVAVAFKKSGVNASELFDYVRQVGSFPPPIQLPRIPVAELAAETPMEQVAVKLEELSPPNGKSKVEENQDSAEREHTQQLEDSRPKKGGGRRPFPYFFASKADDLGIVLAPPRIEPECILSPVSLMDESLPTISCLSPPLLTAAAAPAYASTAEDDGVVVAAAVEEVEKTVSAEESTLRAPPTCEDPSASTAYEPLPSAQQRQEDISDEGVQRERLLMKLPKLKLKKHIKERVRREEEGVKRAGEAPRVDDAQETPAIQSSSILNRNETTSIEVPKEEEYTLTTPVSTKSSMVLPPTAVETVPKLVFRRPVAVEVDEQSRKSHKKEKKAKRKRSEQGRKDEKHPKGPRTPPPKNTSHHAQQETADSGEPGAEFSASVQQGAQPGEPELKPKITLTIKIGQQPSTTSRENPPSTETGTQNYDDLVPPTKKVRRDEAELDDESTSEPPTPTPSCETKVVVETARAPSLRPSEKLPPIETVDRAPAANSPKRKAYKQPVPAGSSKLAPWIKPPPPKIKLAPVKKGAAKKVPTPGERTAKKSTSSTSCSVKLKKTPTKAQKKSTVAKGKKATKKEKAAQDEKEGDSVCPVCSVAYTDVIESMNACNCHQHINTPITMLQDTDAEWICCDECDKWYHWHCVGILFEPPKEKKWYCPKCKKDK